MITMGSAETRHSDQQNPAVFLLSIRSTKHGPRKLADVKRIARNEQLGLTICEVSRYTCPGLIDQEVDFLLVSGKMGSLHSLIFLLIFLLILRKHLTIIPRHLLIKHCQVI